MKKIMKSALIGVSAVLLVLTLTASSCESKPDDLAVARETQREVMGSATEAVPPYLPTEFPAREDINWYLQETEQRATWYVYAINREGRPIFYVVSDMKPRNICISITAPDRRVAGSQGNVVMSAPALDGVYYGGAGCDAYYLRDAATGNFIEIAGQTFTLIASKVPLRLETDWGPVPQLQQDTEPAGNE